MAKPKSVTEQPIDIIKARAQLNAARKAFDIVDRKRGKALARLNAAQGSFDKAIDAIKADAPAGSSWERSTCTLHFSTNDRAEFGGLRIESADWPK